MEPAGEYRHSDDDRRARTSSNEDNEEAEEEVQEEEEVGEMYGGLIFLKTTNRESLVHFYKDRIKMKLWLEQPNITILSHGNFLLGFHQIERKTKEKPDVSGVFTFVYPSKAKVDEMYESLQPNVTWTDAPPRTNDRYKIYQFFAKDPEGRKIEFQAFLHPLEVVSSEVP